MSWRVRRLRETVYSTKEWAVWGGNVEDSPWYPDLAKVHEIARSVGFRTRQATPEDLDLLREHHDRIGRPLRYRLTRQIRRRWAAGDVCFVALDRQGSIVAHMWVAYTDHYVEPMGTLFRLGPTDALTYDVDTSLDKRGSMAFLACSCASVAEGLRRGRRRAIAWSTPELFERFRRLHWFSGLGTARLHRLERITCVLGIRFRRVLQNADERSDAERQPDAE